MKVLLDENISGAFQEKMPDDINVVTTRRMRWMSKDNGELLSAAAAASFDAVVTLDKNMEYQQNVARLPLPVIVLAPETQGKAAVNELADDAVRLLRGRLENRFYRVSASG